MDPIQEYKELTERIKTLKKIIKSEYDKNFVKKAPNRIVCDVCRVSIAKHSFETHCKSNKHQLAILRPKPDEEKPKDIKPIMKRDRKKNNKIVSEEL